LYKGRLNIYCLNILKGKQMKTMILAAASAVLLLGACSTTEQRVLKPEELSSIKHVCIIQNAKVRPHDLDRALSKALAKRGIGSTIVTADNRGKLYDSSCPYNLRYKTKGNNEILRKGVFVLRSTKYAVSTVSYSLNDENHFRTNPDLVKQAEGVVAKLLEKNSK
jgi:putative lipoprotein